MKADPAMTKQQKLITSSNPLHMYRQMVVGESSTREFLYYEFCTLLFSSIPGLVGLAARSVFYSPMFRDCSSRPAIGRGVLLRGPSKISLGNKVMLDDFSVLDCRGAGASIQLNDCVSVGRSSAVVAKGGNISIGRGTNIGSNCRVASQTKLDIGESVLIAAYSYIGPGNHRRGDDENPLISQEMEIKGGVTIGSHVWIGTRATILDGVSIGKGAIIGAHSLVREDVPENAIAVGSPAKIVGSV